MINFSFGLCKNNFKLFKESIDFAMTAIYLLSNCKSIEIANARCDQRVNVCA